MTFYFEPEVINKMKSLETYNKQDDISCVNGIIIRAIKEDADVEILYTNSVGINKVFHIRSIKLSSKYGNDYIVAFCDEACKELTFKIEQIKRANIIWNMVHSKNMKAPEDGMYLMACRGDMHLIYELYYYSKGSPFFERFTNENEHYNNQFKIIPIAYHFIPLYSQNDSINWTSYKHQDNILADGLYIFASTKNVEFEDCLGQSVKLSSTFNYLNENLNGLYYSLERCGRSPEMYVMKNEVDILGYHFCMLL